MIQLLIIYWGVGFNHFLMIYLAMLVVAETAMGIGLLVSAISPHVASATAIAPVFNMPMILFGGFISNLAATPVWLAWIQWVSPIRYGNECLAHSQFDDVPPAQKYPAMYLETQGFTFGYWNCIFVLLAFMVCWRGLSLMAIRLTITKFQ